MKFSEQLRQVQRDSRVNYNKYLTVLKNMCIDSAKEDYSALTLIDILDPDSVKKEDIKIRRRYVDKKFIDFLKENQQAISKDTGLGFAVSQTTLPNKEVANKVVIKWDKDYYKY